MTAEVDSITHPNITDGWFTETAAMWPGQAMKLQVTEVLHHEKSEFQDVLVFQSSHHGNVLVLDGVIQATERDEFAYQEMLAHLPLNSHPNPQKVLVIGGGDGGILREVLKHPSIEEAVLVEIDEAVPRVSKKFLPSMAVGFAHPKVKVIIGDGFQFLKDNTGVYDVVITDSSDPVGPAESLFQGSFFQLLKNALRPGGIIATQGECQWLHLPLIKTVISQCKEIYPSVSYAYASVPTYPCGQIGFILASTEKKDFTKPLRKFTPEFERDKLRYYHAQMHEAAFVLPQFVRGALEL
ncbi:spermidine synthase [Synchytrium microbalum]|uniref:Spermidine synthase n=1 Tax=Synchytrium microbalum TaxID=1806994 RepID=A0A507CCN1_9FUNG|nr:spermidine synthase [Synchytrium microbalum]TPX35796.1 spermidine synthase [Synchytrium microbalum]